MATVFTPRWSITYGITNGLDLYVVGTSETVIVEIPINPIDFAPAATVVALNVSGFYEVSDGHGLWYLRVGDEPLNPRSPVGVVRANLILDPTNHPQALPAFSYTMQMPSSTTLVQVSMCNDSTLGRTTLRAAWLTANAF